VGECEQVQIFMPQAPVGFELFIKCFETSIHFTLQRRFQLDQTAVQELESKGIHVDAVGSAVGYEDSTIDEWCWSYELEHVVEKATWKRDLYNKGMILTAFKKVIDDCSFKLV
jgi:hypothetical protein